MGKRLYPIAKAGVTEVEVFNAVAPELGYATITPERLAVYNDLTQKRKDGAISDDAYYQALYSDGNGDICRYNAFVVFGFGKFHSRYEEHSEVCGSEREAFRVVHLCVANDIPTDVLSLIEGFTWG